MIPQIAADLLVDVKTAALLSTAFTLPYALVQPVLGTDGRFLRQDPADEREPVRRRARRAGLRGGDELSLLVAMRIVAGLVAGGVFPVAMALIGDLVPVNQRQVAIGRLLAIGLTGNLLGASIAGVIGDCSAGAACSWCSACSA